MKTPILPIFSFLISIITVLSLVGCSTITPKTSDRNERKIASAPSNVTSSDMVCYRDVIRASNNPVDFPWGFDGPVVLSLGEVWTERYGSSDQYNAQNTKAIVKWYPQFGVRYGIIDGDMKLMLELPPYSTAGFLKNCQDAEESNVDLVEIVGRRYLISTSGDFISGIHDPITMKSISPVSPNKKIDECLLKESRRQTLQYKGWEKDIRDHGQYFIPVNVEGKTPYLPAQAMPEVFYGDLVQKLGSSFSAPIRQVYTDYQNRVKDQKLKMRVRTQAPYFEEDKTPPNSDEFLKRLEFQSCGASQYFQSIIDSVKKQIKSCEEAYPRLHLDCSQ